MMSELSRFYEEVREILNKARQKSYSAVNSAMVEAYWLIGKRIVEEEQNGNSKAKYGEYLIKELSKKLTQDLGKGFSYANLWNFRQFYQTFPDKDILYTLCRELNWSQLRLIMRVENDSAKKYYLEEARIQQWSARQLQRNINTLYYERLLSSQDKRKELEKQSAYETNITSDFIKDPYVLEFLQIEQKIGTIEKTLNRQLSVICSRSFWKWGRVFLLSGDSLGLVQKRIISILIWFFITIF